MNSPTRQAKSINKIDVGSRVIKEKGELGTVQYIGKIGSSGTGEWLGISLDKPFGENNGSFNGTAYFKCKNKHGVFVRRNQVRLLLNAYSDMIDTSAAAIRDGTKVVAKELSPDIVKKQYPSQSVVEPYIPLELQRRKSKSQIPSPKFKEQSSRAKISPKGRSLSVHTSDENMTENTTIKESQVNQYFIGSCKASAISEPSKFENERKRNDALRRELFQQMLDKDREHGEIVTQLEIENFKLKMELLDMQHNISASKAVGSNLERQENGVGKQLPHKPNQEVESIIVVQNLNEEMQQRGLLTTAPTASSGSHQEIQTNDSFMKMLQENTQLKISQLELENKYAMLLKQNTALSKQLVEERNSLEYDKSNFQELLHLMM